MASSHIAHRVALPDGREAWTVLGVDGSEVGPVSGFLRYLHRIERSPNTVRAYAFDLKLFWDFLAGRGLTWDAVNVANLGDFAAWLRRPEDNVVPLPGVKPARSPSTTNRALSAVMGFYEFHARHGVPVAAALVEHGRRGRGSYRPFLYGIAKPFLYGIAKGSSRARVGRVRTVRELPKVLTLAQIVAVIAAQRRLRDRLLFALLAETGMRVSQALGLRHEDMRTWERRVELVPREDNANGARGKGARGFAIVSDQLVRLHALYMAEEYGLIDSDYVFVNLWAGEIGAPLRYGAVDAMVRRTRARVGFEFHPHMFRHTFVTVARRYGMPLDVISKAVGHACVQTTADIYSHLDAEDLRRELAAAGMLDRLGDLV
ncbi:MAG: tyrosine-type recombinase/integrase [Solirubrobacteraceae bacterium]